MQGGLSKRRPVRLAFAMRGYPKLEIAPIILAHEAPFHLGPVEVRPATRELACDGKTAILEPRVMQVLVALHNAKGAVVSKDDLVTCCWGGRIVGDDAINRVIGRLRHDAAVCAANSFRIETITRVGYRLVGQGDLSARSPLDRRRLVIGGTAAAVAAAAGTIGWRTFRRPTINKEADALVEEARVAMRQSLPDQLSNAIAKLRRASDLDPSNAEIWGMLAIAYQQQNGVVPTSQRPFVEERATDARRRALAIDPDNGDALAAGVMAIPQFGNWLAVEQAARDALHRQPRNANVNLMMGTLLLQVGRPRAALAYLDRVYRAEPLAVGIYVWRTFALWSAGRLDEADNTIDRAFNLWPRHFGIWFSRIYLLAYTGRALEALAIVLDTATRPIGIPDWNFDFTTLEVRAVASGSLVDVDRAMANALEVAKRGTGFAENVTLFAGAVGRIDDAYGVLDGYYFDRGFSIGDRRWSNEQGMYAERRARQTYFLFDPPLAGLRRDPRFATLIRRIGLTDYWNKSGTRPEYLA